MPRLEKTSTHQSTNRKPCLDDVWQEVRDLFASRGLSAESARWFVHECIPSYNRNHEAPSVVSVVGMNNSTRWVTPYRDRAMQCAMQYLSLSESDANHLHAGVEDGVRWRGEPIAQYLDIYRETMRMRQIGVSAYRAETKAKIRALTA